MISYVGCHICTHLLPQIYIRSFQGIFQINLVLEKLDGLSEKLSGHEIEQDIYVMVKSWGCLKGILAFSSFVCKGGKGFLWEGRAVEFGEFKIQFHFGE